MNRLLHLLVLTVALSGCAPTRPAPTPAPAPAAPAPDQSAPRTEAPPADAPAADEAAVTTAPENWWLLEPSGGRFFGVAAERAYREILGGREPKRTVVVAIIDSGVDVAHEDLHANIWSNPQEIAGNDRDDDGNGYVDDVHGWNFLGSPDGRHVHHDTYEVTRLYARYHRRFGTADPDTLAPAARAEYERYREIRDAFESDRAEAEAELAEIRGIEAAVSHFHDLLRKHLGTDSLTVERVSGVRTLRPDLLQAKRVYLELEARGITTEAIAEQREHVENRLRYGLNPEFDPRGLVGDDYGDPSERVYGNADVEGPDADHGTHVAGIVAAIRGNGVGMDGIATGVRIMALRAVPDGDERDKDVANAIRYAVDQGAHIVNMSFGKAYSPEKTVVDEAVRYAESRGVLLVHAAGNDGSDVDEESSFPTSRFEDGGVASNWIEVGASAWQAVDSLAAPFSNYGDERVDVFAPGVDIYSTVPGNGYERFGGTSMAAPVVSGLAALIMAYFPELDAAEVKQVILDSATRYPGQAVARPGAREEGESVPFERLSRTGGIVNAYAALRLAEQRANQK